MRIFLVSVEASIRLRGSLGPFVDAPWVLMAVATQNGDDIGSAATISPIRL